ncbi:DUF6146 family protein [Flavobacterium sp.]|uniref:DUF6146 family protein n=1 Tax=Flavobacterium sp. TaxID=239 RepID=UPI00391B6043
MKTLISLLLVLLAVIGCNSSKNIASNDISAKVSDTVKIANEELEYEVIIIDPGFSSWVASRARPRGYYSESYLENKNQLYVMEWNSRALQPQRYNNLYQMRIDYDPSIRYGYEVNYLIFNYFVYFQVTYNQRLGGIVPFP